MSHPTLHYALRLSQPDKGTLRESFLLSQTLPNHQVEYTDQGDFRLDRRVTLKVGGVNKSRRQIAELSEAYVAARGIEIGYGSKVPLWMFGLLY